MRSQLIETLQDAIVELICEELSSRVRLARLYYGSGTDLVRIKVQKHADVFLAKKKLPKIFAVVVPAGAGAGAAAGADDEEEEESQEEEGGDEGGGEHGAGGAPLMSKEFRQYTELYQKVVRRLLSDECTITTKTGVKPVWSVLQSTLTGGTPNNPSSPCTHQGTTCMMWHTHHSSVSCPTAFTSHITAALTHHSPHDHSLRCRARGCRDWGTACRGACRHPG